MRSAISRGVLFAVGDTADGLGRFSGVMSTAEEFDGSGICWNDDKFREKCREELGTNCVRSGVEMMVLAIETFRQ